MSVPLWCTIPTGFEGIALKEVGSMFGDECKLGAVKEKGKVYFQVSRENFLKVKEMRSADHLFVFVERFPDFCVDEWNIKEKLEELPSQLKWNDALQVWQEYSGFEGAVNKLKQRNGEGDDVSAPSSDGVTRPRFRVTCNRSGRQHMFSSPQAASYFGGAIDDHFDWIVNLSDPDIEVVLNIYNDSAIVGIALTKESLHKRDIKHFGVMTLRSTIAYGLLSLADISPGDLVCDPMCGSGAISVEGAVSWSNSYHLCGDNYGKAVRNTKANAREQETRKCGFIDVCRWDVCNLPLRNESIDVIVTDMPFGKRSGSRAHNKILYPRALNEMARVCKPGSSRCVILTKEQKIMMQILRGSRWWTQKLMNSVNVGGIAAGVYTLSRTVNAYSE